MNIRNPIVSSVVVVALFWFVVGMALWYFFSDDVLGAGIGRAWGILQILLLVSVIAAALPFIYATISRRRHLKQLAPKAHLLQRSTLGRVPLHRVVALPPAPELARSASRLEKALNVPIAKGGVIAALFNTLEHQPGKLFRCGNQDLQLDDAAIVVARRMLEQASNELSTEYLTILSLATLLCLVDAPEKKVYKNQEIDGRKSALVLSRYALFHELPFEAQRLCNLALSFISKCDNIPVHAPQLTSDYVATIEHGMTIPA